MATSCEDIIDEVGAEQGWNTASKLDLVLQYIENQGSNEAFQDFLQEAAVQENSASTAMLGNVELGQVE